MTTTDKTTVPDAAAPDALPRWDLTHLFPGVGSPEFDAAFDAIGRSLADLKSLFDAHGIASRGADAPADAATVAAYEEVTRRYNAFLDELRLVGTYVRVHTTIDSRDDAAQARLSELRGLLVTLSLLGTRYTAFVGSLDADALIAASPLAAENAFLLREARTAARHLLPPGEEELAAELYPSSGAAWARLHGDVTSQLAVPLARRAGGPVEELPMSLVRALATEADGEVRRRAYDAELAAWKTVAVPLAAAMNGIKHASGVLAARRGWGTPLDVSLFQNRIDRETLDAMLSAARDSFPDFRRYLRAKARLVSGAERLPWWDLFAPVGGAAGAGAAAGAFSWAEAEAFVSEHFGAYSAKMRGLADRAFREKWVDAEPRPGKRDGAYCTSLRDDESLILHNYQPSFRGVSTLAHELGHAYHNLCLAERAPLQRSTPMTLAETASIFCETIVKRAALARADREEGLMILEASLQNQCQVVVDITSRFLFEQGVLEKRKSRELSVDELCALMEDAQRQTYGDGLDGAHLHPYMWAVKGHYYGSSFYNYPYMFGLLFGLGLFAHYLRDPEPFRARYDELLSRTGMADAATLAAGFDIDLRDKAFWASSLGVIREDIDRFEKLATAVEGA